KKVHEYMKIVLKNVLAAAILFCNATLLHADELEGPAETQTEAKVLQENKSVITKDAAPARQSESEAKQSDQVEKVAIPSDAKIAPQEVGNEEKKVVAAPKKIKKVKKKKAEY